MPAPPRPDAPNNTIRCAISGEYESTNWANVLWVRNGSGSTVGASDLDDFAAAFGAAYKSAFDGLLLNTWDPQTCTCLLYGTSGPAHVADAPIAGTGSVSDLRTPAQVACCISWRVSTPYRGGHPRTYLAGIPDGSMSDATSFTSGFRDDVADAANGFHAAVNALSVGAIGDVHLGTVSFVHDNAWRTPPVFRDFTPAAAQVDSRVDTQRRRLGPDR